MEDPTSQPELPVDARAPEASVSGSTHTGFDIKQAVVRLLMALSFLLGFWLWFLFMPVQVEIRLSISFTGFSYLDIPPPKPGDPIRIEHLVHGLIGPSRRGLNVKLIRVHDDESVTVEMMRWQYYWYCKEGTWWYLGPKPS